MAKGSTRKNVGEVVPTPDRFYLPPKATGSSWNNVFSSLWNAQKKRGITANSKGDLAPRLTNREAIALVEAWRAVAPLQTTQDFALAYQFEAVAWGWDPTSDAFDLSAKQAERLYPIEPGGDLWVTLSNLSKSLDKEARADIPPGVELDKEAFSDVLVQGDVRRKLIEDGGVVAFKSPLVDAIKEGLKKQKDAVDDAVKKGRGILPKRPQEIARDVKRDLLLLAAGVAAFLLVTRLRRRRPRRVLRRRATRRRLYA